MRRLDRATIAIQGLDRRSWLNGVVTQDIEKLLPGLCVYGLALSRTGKIASDLFCVETGERVLVAVAREALAPLLAQWEQMLVMEDAELRDASTDWQWALVVSASGESPRPESSADCHQGALELASRGSRLIAARADVDIASFGLDELDDTQWREFRLEQLLPEFGVDFSASDRPHEASLDRRAVSWTKGCYLGQEVVCMQEMRGKVQRRLWVFSASEPFAALPEPGSDLCDASGAKVGTVTSAANSRRLGRGLLMARLETRAENGPVTLASGQPLSPLSEPVS